MKPIDAIKYLYTHRKDNTLEGACGMWDAVVRVLETKRVVTTEYLDRVLRDIE